MLLLGAVKLENLRRIIDYLEHQVADGAHILQFRSTHQYRYYKTVKYELHRTTGDEDTPNVIFHEIRI